MLDLMQKADKYLWTILIRCFALKFYEAITINFLSKNCKRPKWILKCNRVDDDASKLINVKMFSSYVNKMYWMFFEHIATPIVYFSISLTLNVINFRGNHLLLNNLLSSCHPRCDNYSQIIVINKYVGMKRMLLNIEVSYVDFLHFIS